MPGIWSSKSSGSVSGRVWKSAEIVDRSGSPARLRSANSSGEPTSVTR